MTLPDYIHRATRALWIAQQQGAIVDSCYQLSEALADFARSRGHEAEAIPVDVFSWNVDAETLVLDPALRKRMDILAASPLRYARLSFKQRAIVNNIRPKFVGIDHEQRVDGDGYNGHVVTLIDGIVVDVTAHQMTRSDYGLDVPPVVMYEASIAEQDPASWIRYEGLIPETSYRHPYVRTALPGGGHLAYFLRADITDKPYMLRHDRVQENIDSVTELIEEMLGASPSDEKGQEER